MAQVDTCFFSFLALVSCGLNTAAEPKQGTPTPTLGAPEGLITPTANTSLCNDLVGEIEVQVLAGPVEAVGLEPFSVGFVSFYVTTGVEPYVVEGSGQLEYDEILSEEWGSYEVELLLNTTINGECEDQENDGNLNLVVEISRTQMVEVIADNFHGQYPWQGTIPFDLFFPLVDGAVIEGEGWAFTLHLPER
ncbi:MAG: hypothetical protein MUO54_06265 [Anaerolineales bacterium]|nr:hypothetical protein [Anaerolineales bacterium]